MKDTRYLAWCDIADELDALSTFAFSEFGPWSSRPYSDALGSYAAEWIRKKCNRGWWYWWDRSTLYAVAMQPLRNYNRIESEGGLDDTTEAGKELKARIERLRTNISKLESNAMTARNP